MWTKNRRHGGRLPERKLRGPRARVRGYWIFERTGGVSALVRTAAVVTQAFQGDVFHGVILPIYEEIPQSESRDEAQQNSSEISEKKDRSNILTRRR